MKTTHAVIATHSFVVCVLSILNCSTFTSDAADDQVVLDMRSCEIMRLTPL